MKYATRKAHVVPRTGAAFTVRDLSSVVEKTERKERDDASWLGGVDVHHVFFEGLHATADDSWRSAWGS